MSIKSIQKETEEIEEREIIATEEDIDKNDTAYFENREKELRQQESEIVERLAESIINGDMASCISLSRKINKIKEDLIALKEEKNELNKAKVEYYENVLNPTDIKKLITVEQIAEDLHTTATELNNTLKDLGIQYEQSNTWFFYKQYDYLIREDYADYVIDEFGQTLNWTEKGRQFIIDKLNENNYLKSNGTF